MKTWVSAEDWGREPKGNTEQYKYFHIDYYEIETQYYSFSQANMKLKYFHIIQSYYSFSQPNMKLKNPIWLGKCQAPTQSVIGSQWCWWWWLSSRITKPNILTISSSTQEQKANAPINRIRVKKKKNYQHKLTNDISLPISEKN